MLVALFLECLGKQQHGEFGLPVGAPRVVMLATIEIVEIDLSAAMRQARQLDDACWR